MDGADGDDPSAVRWTPKALPTVVALTASPSDLGDAQFNLPEDAIGQLIHLPEALEAEDAALRLHVDVAGAKPPAVLLPLDRLFDIRLKAAERLWQVLTGRRPGPDPGRLSKARRDRLILALEALDHRLGKASYRQIAERMFGEAETGASWKSHDLRDRTVRLVRLGVELMHGGYRRLLRHPFRQRE